MELDVLHSSHHYWLVLCFESSAGSPVWVSVPRVCVYMGVSVKKVVFMPFFFPSENLPRRERGWRTGGPS